MIVDAVVAAAAELGTPRHRLVISFDPAFKVMTGTRTGPFFRSRSLHGSLASEAEKRTMSPAPAARLATPLLLAAGLALACGDSAPLPAAGAGDPPTAEAGRQPTAEAGLSPTDTDTGTASRQSDLGRTLPADIDPLYAPWTRILRTWVDEEGLVDYAGLQAEGRSDLRAFMDAIAGVDPAELDSDAHRIAFWINAYNATVLWQVVEAYPLDSVRDVGSLWGLIGGFFKVENRVAGADRSLDDIEHGILRARYPDPEIHWTLVCAAFGCPRLIRRPYVADDLEPLLEELAHEFLAQPRALRVDREAGVLHLSRYFDWYGDDFRAEAGTIVDYVLQYAPEDAAAWIRDRRDELEVEFIEYDWTLNDQAKGPRAAR